MNEAHPAPTTFRRGVPARPQRDAGRNPGGVLAPDRVHVKQDRVVQELLRIALANPAQAFDATGALLPIHEVPEDVQRAISGFDVEERNGETVVKKIRFWDKTRALEMLGRHIGLLRDRNEDGKSAAVFHLVINGIAPKGEALPVVDAKALPAKTAESGT